ncbi:hypothetical protein H112_06438 [Trichophyton rubrum D6]|uniref:C2H2-type domain-containing protein n=2 Tax=Trichophyton rubrum TaxID=5551 RepID=A0A178F238_TRIRU|nr:hypothetical protein H100_06452 [Trichophyton rubrum MR850]EZF39411.1 hypothetical protein H102_06418 [Trichophyton rubrum CBS 100081]EZF50064.1 hypothetical protein H103_06446 [Trichophyton rubrum CBS 288.86]EZF60642.1 hypothetical protein H104_06430 [Trichophyton rubrum CBS 289.86]EZF81990.1 hypothetical protein H110_06441 [Trichophyton rubrum MR1448]EZF92657.1 hypothetical protein H113_06491 [Trichophyton rubrum MR1459]EZG14190.1 hypothetical protein H107_06589 [Trichophyton rubrum CBS 
MHQQSSSYPTTPQSCTQTDSTSLQSSLATGLGLLNCSIPPTGSSVSICSPSQSMLQVAQGWHGEPSAGHCFPNTSSSMVTYPILSVYDSLQVVPNASISSFGVPSTHVDTSSAGFLSPVPLMKVESSSTIQSNIYAPDMSSNYGVSPSPTQSPQILNEGMSDGWEIIANDNAAKQAFLSMEDLPLFHQQIGSPAPARQLREINTPVLTSTPIHSQRKPRRSPLRTSDCNKVVGKRTSELDLSSPDMKIPPKKKRSLDNGNGKYECEQCGRQFTRNSNCRSHMKIHDPNRRYPHKCTIGQCSNKFSRKTDLIRHIDSVHKKLKRFGCDQCGHRFARQDTLRRHREDGCRRQQQHRQALLERQQQEQLQHHHHHRQPASVTAPIAPSGLDASQAYPIVSIPYHESVAAYTTHPQLHAGLVRPYLNPSNETFHEYI